MLLTESLSLLSSMVVGGSFKSKIGAMEGSGARPWSTGCFEMIVSRYFGRRRKSAIGPWIQLLHSVSTIVKVFAFQRTSMFYN